MINEYLFNDIKGLTEAEIKNLSSELGKMGWRLCGNSRWGCQVFEREVDDQNQRMMVWNREDV